MLVDTKKSGRLPAAAQQGVTRMGQAAEWSRSHIGDRTLRWSRPPVRAFLPRLQEHGGRPQGTEAETGIELMLQRLPPFP